MKKSSPLTVLIVDDEKDVIRFLSMALEDNGFKVLTASNAVEACNVLEKKIPDLVSLDVVMPGGSGIKLQREMKKKPAWAKIPILIVTGHARDELGKADFTEMTMSGPGVYLEKPVTAVKYIAAVKKILGLSEEEKDSVSQSSVKNELKTLIDTTDPETLQEILKLMKSKKKG